jgi:4-amino-4-deoxy-L-arabinose transferase-like glycosyltransferase
VSTAVDASRSDVSSAVRARAGAVERLAAVAVFALAAALRFAGLGRTPLDPFYDASVRSMGTSWHAFLVGAFEPSARLAIDKPPLDLWLQVASTKLFGFVPFALLLPAAVGGTLAVVALYDLLRTLAGSRVALAGALALAVLPVTVITSRSDTMDSVMAAVVVAAFAVAARGLHRASARHALAAGALLGLAFEVKLFEALVAALPLALMWWLGARASRRRRLRTGAVALAAFLVVALAWLVVVTTVVPASQRPWAFGSSNGSPWNAAFVYDGWDRLTGATSASAAAPGSTARIPGAPGPLRLLSATDHIGGRLGIELAAAWAALALLVVTRAWRTLDRPGRAGIAALATWLALGTVMFSAQRALRPRYLEAFDPAVAACLGVGVVLAAGALAARLRRAAPAIRAVSVGALSAVLVSSLAASVHAATAHVEDSGTVGALPSARVQRLSAYLRAHQGSARYELASLAASPAAPIIVRDARPVLVLTADGRSVVSPHELAELVAADQVRTALVGTGCTSAACTSLERWIRAHGVDVGRAAGDPQPGSVFALGSGSGS